MSTVSVPCSMPVGMTLRNNGITCSGVASVARSPVLGPPRLGIGSRDDRVEQRVTHESRRPPKRDTQRCRAAGELQRAGAALERLDAPDLTSTATLTALVARARGGLLASGVVLDAFALCPSPWVLAA
jgi:hypothetical protein